MGDFMDHNLTSQVMNALEVLKQANVPYCKQIDCLGKINSLRTQKAEIENAKPSKTTIILEIFACYIALAIIPASIFGYLLKSSTLLSICVPMSFIIAIFIRIPLHKRIYERFSKKEINDYEERIQKQKQILEQYRNETSHILNSNLETLSVIPQFYFQKYKVDELVEVVNMLYEILASERADSKKEALNILENDLHNLRMELAQSEILAQQAAIQQSAEYAAWQAQKTADYIAWQSFFSSV